jgi:hypothetical protein
MSIKISVCISKKQRQICHVYVPCPRHPVSNPSYVLVSRKQDLYFYVEKYTLKSGGSDVITHSHDLRLEALPLPRTNHAEVQPYNNPDIYPPPASRTRDGAAPNVQVTKSYQPTISFSKEKSSHLLCLTPTFTLQSFTFQVQKRHTIFHVLACTYRSMP